MATKLHQQQNCKHFRTNVPVRRTDAMVIAECVVPEIVFLVLSCLVMVKEYFVFVSLGVCSCVTYLHVLLKDWITVVTAVVCVGVILRRAVFAVHKGAGSYVHFCTRPSSSTYRDTHSPYATSVRLCPHCLIATAYVCSRQETGRCVHGLARARERGDFSCASISQRRCSLLLGLFTGETRINILAITFLLEVLSSVFQRVFRAPPGDSNRFSLLCKQNCNFHP